MITRKKIKKLFYKYITLRVTIFLLCWPDRHLRIQKQLVFFHYPTNLSFFLLIPIYPTIAGYVMIIRLILEMFLNVSEFVQSHALRQNHLQTQNPRLQVSEEASQWKICFRYITFLLLIIDAAGLFIEILSRSKSLRMFKSCLLLVIYFLSGLKSKSFLNRDL